MSAKINCNFPGCTASFETRDDLHKHVEEAKHQETIHVVVRNLAYAFTLEELQKEFEGFHPREVRIATRRDGKSKGFALAFFDKEEDRAAAIEALNDKELGGRKVKVSKPRGRTFTAYVGKFKTTPSEEDVKAAFAGIEVTKIEVIQVAAEKDYAYVTFATEDDFKKALDLKTVLEANVEAKRPSRRRKLGRKPAPKGEKAEKPKAEKKEAAAATEVPKPAFTKNTVHVGKLPAEATRESLIEDLKGLFASLNPATVKVVIRKSHGRFPAIAYGIVSFNTEEEYNQALEIKKLGDKDIVVDPKRAVPRRKKAAAAPKKDGEVPRKATRKPRAPRAPRSPAKLLKDTLFVGKLPNIITDEGLNEIFDGCNFVSAKIHEGKNSKYGVVVFANEEDAQKALDTVKGTSVEGNEIIVEFKRDIAEKKN